MCVCLCVRERERWPRLGHLSSGTEKKAVLVVKNVSANAGDVRDEGWEDPLEEGMATHFSLLAWRIPWTEQPGRLHSTRSHKIGHE